VTKEKIDEASLPPLKTEIVLSGFLFEYRFN